MKARPLALVLTVLGILFLVAALARVAVGAVLFLIAAGLFLLAIGAGTWGRKGSTEGR